MPQMDLTSYLIRRVWSAALPTSDTLLSEPQYISLVRIARHC